MVPVELIGSTISILSTLELYATDIIIGSYNWEKGKEWTCPRPIGLGIHWPSTIRLLQFVCTSLLRSTARSPILYISHLDHINSVGVRMSDGVKYKTSYTF